MTPTSPPARRPRHALAETAVTYGTEARAAFSKLSISLPTQLVEQLRDAAAESGISVSGIVAAAIRRSIAAADQDRLEQALELDAEDNEAWANATLASTAKAWANLEW